MRYGRAMAFFEALWREAHEALTLWAFLTIVAVVVLSRVLPGGGGRHQRTPATIGLFGLHLVLLVVTAALVVTGKTSAANDARVASNVLLVMSWVGAGVYYACVVALVVVANRNAVPRAA